MFQNQKTKPSEESNPPTFLNLPEMQTGNKAACCQMRYMLQYPGKAKALGQWYFILADRVIQIISDQW